MEKNFFMKRALQLAQKAVGKTSPNPMVGAVVVKNNKVIGSGYHHAAGLAHAEVVALKQAGNRAKGSTLYVTLEPCTHIGKTPPCVDAIIQAGIKQVHIAMLDPNKIVFGKGKKRLEKAGIQVKIGNCAQEAQQLNEAFIMYHTKKRPYVIAKWAMTMDGKIATHSGDSKWISSEKSRTFVHQLRSQVDAVLVGVETVIKDDPQLTVRLPNYKDKQPLRIILDRSGRVPSDSRVFKNPNDILIFRENNLSSLMKLLYERNILSVLVEGGGTVLASFFENKLIDKVYVFIAPKVIGGKDALTPVEGAGVSSISKALQLKNMQVKKSGSDFLIIAYV